MTKPKTPKALDTIADVVLAYRPKAKSKPAVQRKRRATRMKTKKEKGDRGAWRCSCGMVEAYDAGMAALTRTLRPQQKAKATKAS